jgi:phospholipid/cholesterol/gamma-HCH transport system permease protein
MTDAVMADEAGWYRFDRAGDGATLAFGGRWDLNAVARLDQELRALDIAGLRRTTIELSGIDALDASGAWILLRTRSALTSAGGIAEFVGLRDVHRALIERFAAPASTPPVLPPRQPPFLALLARLGSGATRAYSESLDIIGFFGLIVVALWRTAKKPQRVRLTSVIAHVERAGLNALPIVGLLSFLIGVVLAYQGVDQLRNFGAEAFTVNLAGISILREIGVLMTAILIAGRSGSAFTAQIGTMRVREEVDALRTLGLDPIDILVLPRILALTMVMPLLAFYADAVGLFGAGVATMLLLDMSPVQFVTQLQQAVAIKHFWVGIVKAPVFGFLIALVGCRYGLKVKGSAENVGRRTTQSVVEAIFLVIVFDAIFSIVFSRLGV